MPSSPNSLCEQCGLEYKLKPHANPKKTRFCSKECQRLLHGSTDEQYKRISGNPKRYFTQNIQRLNRIGGSLLVSEALELLDEQNGRCALTNIPLTFQRMNGIKCPTNASFDRIETGGPYIKNNVRLVCSIVNNMRWTSTDEELKYWCRVILNPVEDN